MITSLLARLRDLAQSLPRPGCEWEERPTFTPPSTTDSLARLEVAAGVPIPSDLREFFSLTDQVIGMSVHNGYQIGGAELLVDALWAGVVVVEGVATIPVAWDGGGNAFLLSAGGDVWQWDHETGGTMMIADSFTAFLERVVADWAAYINDTPGWKYLV